MNDDQLKECPFCGKTPVICSSYEEEDEFKENDECWCVVCDASGSKISEYKGGCGASSGWHKTEAQAIAAWSARLPNPQPVVSREEIQEAIEHWENEPGVSFMESASHAVHALQLPAPQAPQIEGVERIIDFICGKHDYAIIRCEKITREQLISIATLKAVQG